MSKAFYCSVFPSIRKVLLGLLLLFTPVTCFRKHRANALNIITMGLLPPRDKAEKAAHRHRNIVPVQEGKY